MKINYRRSTLLFLCGLIFFSCRKEVSIYGKYEHQVPLPPLYNETLVVFFSDKGADAPSLTDGTDFLSPRALERRQKQNIPLDSTDLPVSKEYINRVLELTNGKLLNTSRWLNYAVIHLPDGDQSLEAINALPYVTSLRALGRHAPYEAPIIEPDGATTSVAATGTMAQLDTISISAANYGKSYRLLTQYQAEFLPQQQFFGEGKYIAILSDGFGYIREKAEIIHLLNEDRIPFTYDFIYNRTDVSATSSTGNEQLGVLGALNPKNYIGLAPKAKFALMRTDMGGAQEPYFETCWVAAMECADSLGVDIVSSSCVYGIQYDDPKYDISEDAADGTSLSSRAADVSFKKGMLTVQIFPQQSGTISFVVPPSDAHDIITAGNLNPSGQALWSALDKTTADGRKKPELAVLGQQIPIIYGWGDSYSTTNTPPILAGLLASLWEAMPSKTAAEIKNIVEQTASQSASRDNILGYGIPNLKKAYEQK